jgi:hypothetical protein
MLQIQTHIYNGTLYLCHTSCSILNAGTLTSYLTTVKTWVQSHPYDIVTILIENGDYVPASTFVSPIDESGLSQYVYTPPKILMAPSDWPTLSTMILAGTRVVLFLDYDANQAEIPWLMDEFSHIWETLFDPADRTFPCTVQRPPGLTNADASSRMYVMNHNLNQQVNLLGNELLIPLKPLLPITNNVSGYGSLGANTENCYNEWVRLSFLASLPPFLPPCPSFFPFRPSMMNKHFPPNPSPSLQSEKIRWPDTRRPTSDHHTHTHTHTHTHDS